MLIGPLGSERQKHVSALAAAHGLKVINLQAELPAKPPPPAATATEEEAAAAKTEWLPEDLASMAKALCAKLGAPPLSTQGVLLEGEPLPEAMTEALLAHNLHPHTCVMLELGIDAAVARVYGSKDVPEYPKPHRLPFYPFLDPRRQRRELRALKALGLSLPLPDPHPRNEDGKPIEPPPTTG